MAGQSIIRWGILGPGGIARDFLAGTQGSQTGRIVAIGARNPDDPALARNFPGIRVAGDYDALLRDDEVDASISPRRIRTTRAGPLQRRNMASMCCVKSRWA
jgi:hypothetical protein